MLAMTAQPSLDQIYGFITKVRRYPVSVAELVKLAKEMKAPKEVVKFYERFDKEQFFGGPDELAGSSEQVEIMHAEKGEMPREAGSPED